MAGPRYGQKVFIEESKPPAGLEVDLTPIPEAEAADLLLSRERGFCRFGRRTYWDEGVRPEEMVDWIYIYHPSVIEYPGVDQ